MPWFGRERVAAEDRVGGGGDLSSGLRIVAVCTGVSPDAEFQRTRVRGGGDIGAPIPVRYV
jgi:hypothetical protein